MPLGTRLKKLLRPKTGEGRSRGNDGENLPTAITQTEDEIGTAVDDDREALYGFEGSRTTTTTEIDAEKEEKEPLEPNNLPNPSDQSASSALITTDIAIDILLILREASEASSVLIPLKIFCTVLHNVLLAAREKLIANTDFESLVKRLDAHHAFIEGERRHLESNNIQEPPDQLFLAALEAYFKTLEEARIALDAHIHNTTRIASYVSGKVADGPAKGLENDLERAFSSLMRQVHNCTLRSTIKTSNGIAETRLSQLLKDSINARGDRVKPLTPGTRLRLIERLSIWADSPDTAERIFWLHDEAGTGKSALAAHMAKHWEKERVLAGRFFFNRNGGRNFRRLDRFCVTLAKEMSETHPLAKANLLSKLSESEIPPFTEAFQSLIINVTEQLSKRLFKPLLFVIDALDECHEDDVQLLTASILSALPNCQGVRFLLTSRPTKEITAILDGISGVGGKDVVLLDVKHGDAERDHDTSIYVRHTLEGFSAADQNTVIQCASGVFLWATLACDTLLRTVTPRRVLDRFENNTPDQAMQILYETALEAALPAEWSSHDLELLHTVLQGVSLTYTPVSIFSIRSFFPRHHGEKIIGEEFVEFFVKKLGSIMKDGTPYLPIYILHPTFREFIEDQKHGARFYISPPDGHQSIAIASLALLMEGLTPNVLSLDDGKSPLPTYTELDFEPPARLSLDIEAPLRYAVAFWATHASLAVSEDDKLQRMANKFFTSKLLAWIEWSSAIHELPECIEGLRRLRWALKVHISSTIVSIILSTKVSFFIKAVAIPQNTTLEQWCSDSLQFLLRNSHIIERCGLQAWMSALVFTPKHSLVYRTFSRQTIRPLPCLLTQYRNISDGSRVLWDVKGPVLFTTFSPDGKRLLAYSRTSACLWNVKSGKLIKDLSDGYSDSLHTNNLAFSSDGSLFASANDDATVCVFDGFTGAIKERKLPRCHKSAILHVAFMLSDTVVASIDEKHHRICFWRVAPTRSWKTRVRIVQGTAHTAQVSKLAVSPDRKLLATFSGDKSAKLWNPETASMVGTAMTKAGTAINGSFSVDGSKLIVGYDDGMLVIWDVETQNPILSIESGSRSVFALAVSPNGRLVAGGDDQLCIWDIETGERVCPPLENSIWCVSFNQSGSRLISGSNTRQITVWDIRSSGGGLNMERTVLKGHAWHINDVASSPSGRIIASASDDGTLRIWDTDLLEMSNVEDLSDDTTHQKVHRVAASHDGRFVVSAGEKGNFQLWDFMNGTKIGSPFHEVRGEVHQLTFSSHSTLWASVHSLEANDIVCVWRYNKDCATPITQVIPCKQGRIMCIVFSHDNRHVFTGGEDRSVRGWDIACGDCIATFAHTGVPWHITVSRDGRHLVSLSENAADIEEEFLCIWDLDSQGLVGGPKSIKEQELRGIYGKVTFIASSPDNMTVMIKRTRSLQLFDARDTRCYATFEEPMDSTTPLDSVPEFSSDGSQVFYWKYKFDISKIPRNNHMGPIHLRSDVSGWPFTQRSHLYLDTFMGCIGSIRWEGPLLILPADVMVRSWVAHESRIAFGGLDGRVFIIHFPEESI